MADKCISCNQTVTTRQQAIQCEEEIEPMFQRLQRHASEPLQQFRVRKQYLDQRHVGTL